MSEAFESFHQRLETPLQSKESRPQNPEPQLARERRESERRQREKTAEAAAKDESQLVIQPFEWEHPELFGLPEVLPRSAGGTRQSNSGYEGVRSEVESRLSDQSETPAFKNFQERFYELFQVYQSRLNTRPLSPMVTINEAVLARLVPDNQELRESVRLALAGQERVSAKELLAVCIFQDLMAQERQDIEHDLEVLHGVVDQPHDNNRPIRIQQVLLTFSLRENKPERSPRPLGLADLQALNVKLQSLETPERRAAFLERFILQMSAAVAVPDSEYRERLALVMGKLKGLETLQATFTDLKQGNQLAEVINDDGTLVLPVLQNAWERSEKKVAAEFQPFEQWVSEKRQEPKVVLSPPGRMIQELSQEEIVKNPVISRMGQINPVIAEHFFRAKSAVRLWKTEEGRQTYELVLNRDNPEHGLSLQVDQATGHATIFVGGVRAFDTPIQDRFALKQDLNSASTRHLTLDALGLPATCFVPDLVEQQEVKERNDPLQLVRTVLGQEGFPDTALLDVTPKLIATFQRIFALALGEEYLNTPPADLKRLLQHQGWLDLKGRLRPEVNAYLAAVYDLAQSEPFLDQHTELWQKLRSDADLAIRRRWIEVERAKGREAA